MSDEVIYNKTICFLFVFLVQVPGKVTGCRIFLKHYRIIRYQYVLWCLVTLTMGNGFDLVHVGI